MLIWPHREPRIMVGFMQGGAMAVAALQAPQLLLPASAVDGLSSALLMVLAASWLRTGSMLLHLKVRLI